MKESEGAPRSLMAIDNSAIEIRSPEVSSISSSLPSGLVDTWLAKSRSSSVVSPMAETTTQTWLPALWVSMMRAATCLILAASPTDEPPYFCTISAN